MADRHQMSRLLQASSTQYLQERRITELFESLTAALVHDRPDEPIDYLLRCLRRTAEIGHRNVAFDTFLPSPPTSRSVSAAMARTEAERPKENKPAQAPSLKLRQNQDTLVDQPILETERERQDATKENEKKPDDTAKETKKIENAQTTRLTDGTKKEEGGGEEGEEVEGETVGDSMVLRQMSQKPQFDDPKVLAIFKGALTDVPKIPTNTVRIFLSSTFSDFRAERNILPKEAYPELQQFCNERGLDFQAIDMRWGVTDEMLNDHQVTDLCLKEIENCRQVSCGPHFVTLLGNRYGYKPYPSVIEKEEFNILMKICEDLKLDGLELLKEWYKEDQNSVPSSFILQPIASKLPYFNDTSNPAKQKADKQTWNSTNETLRTLFARTSQHAFDKGLLIDEKIAKYQVSVTEKEVELGLLKADDARRRAICYERQLDHLTEHLDKKNTSRFVDAIEQEKNKLAIDTDAQKHLNELKVNKVPKAIELPEERNYKLSWKGVNLEESNEEEHRSYLQKFCRQFVSDMKSMINDHLVNKESEQLDEEDMALFHEIVHHAKFANDKLKLFCGREESLAKIKQLLTVPQEQNMPVIVHALSGHGKTSLLAKCASLVPEWLGNDTSVALRFLGTSPQCSNIRDTMLSVIRQMATLLNYSLPSKDKLEKMGEVRRFFNVLIRKIGELHSDQKFVIILDSIDQLSELYGAHRFSWLPRKLPSNVHIIISLLSEFGSILDNCKSRVNATSQYIELEPLTSNTAKLIIETFMRIHKRTLAKDQENLILKAFEKNAQPLFLKLVLDQALQWNSYTPVADIKIATNVRNAIQILFEEIENKYGEVFVRHALSYLTCGNGGLTDIEMDDILSCDDEVLNEVYKYHDPPMEGIIRIPALLWARLGNELSEYLTEKQVDNKTVRTWYHRQFLETSEQHYLSDKSHFRKIHTNLAELFLQQNGIQRTITLTQRGSKTIENADRRVAPQLLAQTNLRKLNSLPYHLYKGQQIDSLTKHCLLDFDFVFTKIKAVGISAVFAEFSDMASLDVLLNNQAVVLMKAYLELTFDALHLDANLFPFFAKDRLGPYKEEEGYQGILPMIESASKWLSSTKHPMLLPTNPLNMTSLDSPIKFSQLIGMSGEVSANEEVAVCLWKEAHSLHSKINVFDLLGRETIATIELSKESPIVITPDNKNFLFWNHDKLWLNELYTGDKVQEIDILDRQYESVALKNIGISNDSRWLVFILKIGKPRGIAEDESWRNQSAIYCVDMASIETTLAFTSQAYSSRRAIEKFIFVENNTKVVALKRDGIQVFSLPDLKELSGQSLKKGIIGGSFANYASEAKVIVGPVIQGNGCNCFIYNWVDNTLKFSPLFHCEETGDNGKQLTAFGTIPKPDISQIIIGTNESGDSRKTRLWIWNTASDDVTRIEVSEGIWRMAVEMVVMADWDHCLIGYQTGDLSLVSITKQQELRDVHCHGNAITTIQFYNHNRNLLTMATDHSLKLWDVNKLFTRKDEEQKIFDRAYGIVPLDTSEQVLEIDCSDKHALTVSQLTKQGVRFWNLDTGLMDVGVTIPHEEIYQGVLNDFKQMGGPRYHGSLELLDDIVVYQRKRRDGFLMYVAQAYEEHRPLACMFFEDSFFSLAARSPGGTERVIFIVRDGKFEKRSLPTLELQSSVVIPKISEEIPNLESKRAKRKLIYYKVAMTSDGKNFIICNPSPSSTTGKYFDWVDVETMTYKGRIPLPATTSWKLLEDSFCFLVVKESSNNAFIYRPSLLPTLEENDYVKPFYGGKYSKGVLSQDNKFGLEIYRDHGIAVWNIDPLCKINTLRGHTSDVNSTSISGDNKFVASGSFDNTVRLWSLESGAMLCLFHLHGNVNGVELTPNKDYIVAKYYSAPQRTRAAILKVWNVEK